MAVNSKLFMTGRQSGQLVAACLQASHACGDVHKQTSARDVC